MGLCLPSWANSPPLGKYALFSRNFPCMPLSRNWEIVVPFLNSVFFYIVLLNWVVPYAMLFLISFFGSTSKKSFEGRSLKLTDKK